MARPTMRRPSFIFLAFLIAVTLSPSASAQETTEPAVRLTLLSQTPWNSSYDLEHGREVLLRFRAENVGSTTIGELSIGVALYGRVISRSAFQAALTTDPPLVIADAESFPREGVLVPGATREFEVTFPLDSGLDPDDSGVYPLKIELRSGFTSLAALRSAVVFLVRGPEVPLALSWTFVLQEPIALGPGGRFMSPALEASLAPEGRLAMQIRSLLGLTLDASGPAVDLAVAPTLLLQLERMSQGYEVVTVEGDRRVQPGEGGSALARQALDDLRSIAAAPTVRVSALPFASPEVPSLLSAGLGRDVQTQIDRGREVVADLLETAPVTTVFRPPGAALDEQTLRALPEQGISTLVAGPSTVSPSPEPLGFAGPATAELGADGRLVAIVPEPAIMARLQSAAAIADPVLTAQVTLAELATIWQEQPGVERGVALVISEDLLQPPPFYGAFIRGVTAAPWLDPMHAGEFTLRFPPASVSELTAPLPRRFGSTYVGELRQVRRRLEIYRSMLAEPSTRPEEYDRMLLLAESRQYLSDPAAGLAFIAAVRDSVGAVLGGITVEAVEEITLASSTGAGIPVTVHNGADEALQVTVRLESQHLLNAPSQDLRLAAGASQTVTFRVDTRSTGRFTVKVQVSAPEGSCPEQRCILAELPLNVRSTVYNRIALAVTIAAAVVLLALWARRLLPRRTSS
jgi:hypothetical protein